MKYLATTLLFCLILGCSTMVTTKVTSDPPGARIEVNNDYMGQTPLEVNWLGYKDKSGFIFVGEKVVKAIPIEPGQEVQIKYFKGTVRGQHWGDAIPKHIFFNMHLVTMPNKYELDVK